ncbi:hypothetical protein ASZ90_004724 [hydrocarbon metagenome]|uniref:Uncharacterized protein n=1 Tax=hydrocarbon metagenome TaxID=938273 RepID=A0A0W8FYW9_9ZZZZ
MLATGLLFYALEYCRSLAITNWRESVLRKNNPGFVLAKV